MFPQTSYKNFSFSHFTQLACHLSQHLVDLVKSHVHVYYTVCNVCVSQHGHRPLMWLALFQNWQKGDDLSSFSFQYVTQHDRRLNNTGIPLTKQASRRKEGEEASLSQVQTVKVLWSKIGCTFGTLPLSSIVSRFEAFVAKDMETAGQHCVLTPCLT